ncbi:MAG: type II toxin-antitoxin system RelE/ParE family toxin [Candidatus Kapaibacterium sp.]
MEPTPRYLEFYREIDGLSPFENWFNSLSLDLQSTVARRLDRIKKGLFGDCKPVGDGVTEFRVDVGPGYRFFAGFIASTVVLLIGCDKRDQQRTISIAKALWKRYKQRIT